MTDSTAPAVPRFPWWVRIRHHRAVTTITVAIRVLVRAARASSPRSRITLAAGVLVLGLGWVLVGPGAGWVLRNVDGVHGLTGKDLAAALDAVRGRALAVATGLLALIAVYYTARNADTARRTAEIALRTYQLGEQGHVTERYTKAIEQLGSESRDIRIGGIYGLERIAADSARDHPTVMEVLTAFVREHALATTRTGSTTGEASRPPAQSAPAADIQAALTVIGRRTADHDTRPLDLSGVEVASAYLVGANLVGANLTAADLADADLVGANLIRAILVSADLTDARLTGANLYGANLDDADLTGADLTRVILTDARLTRANLYGANLTDTDLTGADLTRVILTGAHLTGAHLTDAIWTERTVWPDADIGRIRTASHEIRPGVFRIGDGSPGGPTP